MFPSSLVVIIVGVAFGVFALAAFGWGWRTGAFSHLDQQAGVILDDRDLRLVRPWETPHQRAERAAAFGEPVAPAPSEWGGAQ